MLYGLKHMCEYLFNLYWPALFSFVLACMHVGGRLGKTNRIKLPFKTQRNVLPFLSQAGVWLKTPVSRHLITVVV